MTDAVMLRALRSRPGFCPSVFSGVRRCDTCRRCCSTTRRAHRRVKPSAQALLSSVEKVNLWEADDQIDFIGVVRPGFGRGSRKIGVPTGTTTSYHPGKLLLDTERLRFLPMRGAANLAPEALASAPRPLSHGVYLGWAALDGFTGQTFKMVANVGIAPTFGDVSEPLIEAHLLHAFDEPFYGHVMRLRLAGLLRPETKFATFPELVSNIRNDVEVARQVLEALPSPNIDV